MINLLNYLREVKKNKGSKYIVYQTLLVIFFGFLYWISDYLIIYYPNLAKKFNFGSIREIQSLGTYIFYSLVTQTTVGYSGILRNGGSIMDTKSNLLKIINGIQLFSIFVITGWTISF